MGGINAKEFIDELVFCIKEEDVVKAKALLQFASDSDVNVEVQRKAMIELAKGPEKIVFPLLEYLTKIDISNSKIQDALYELILDKAFGNTTLVAKYIIENEKKARLLFLRAAGDLLLSDTAPVLQKIISEESDKDILIEAITALGKFRLPASLPIFSNMANQPDKAIKQAAIFAISETGGTDAVDQLIGFIGNDEETNKFAVEALSEMQDLYSLDKLATLLSSKVTIVRDTAIDQIIKLGNKATPILTKAFQNAEADYLVHLVTTLGYIGDPAAVTPILDIVNTQPDDANIRQAAYEAMERIPSPKTAISLVQGLQDTVEAVRMSAARAIDKNLSKALVAGLRNVVRDGSEESQNAVAALIDSDAGNIFNFLVEEESFLDLALTHVTTKADPITQKTFLKQMNSIGQKEFAGKLAEQVPVNSEPETQEAQIFVIDDSKMMLRLYQNKLTALGYRPVTFVRPEDAIPQIIQKKPDLVITDLNMPNISGLELTLEVRRKYNRSVVPILMITTQSDFVEENDQDVRIDDTVLTKSGINKILHKPFTDDDFKKNSDSFFEISMVRKYWIFVTIGLAGIFLGIPAGFFYSLIHDLPQINHLKQYKPPAVTTVFSSDNHILARFYNEKRFPIPIQKIPEELITALITIEDRDFYSHSGVNLKAIVRAIVRDIQAGKFKEGASTLTQQLAKTLFLTNEKSIIRKIKEMILTLQIERRYTKNEILELYLNQIYFGSGTYGVEAAAQVYFGKTVSDVSIDEAALLAGLPKAPSAYSPLKNADLAKKRRDIVLYQMLITKNISQNAYKKAKSKPVVTLEKEGQQDPAGYFNAYVKSIIKQQFDLKQVYSKGLNIQTTLRLDMQKRSNQSVTEQMIKIKKAYEKSQLDTEKLQCAVVAVDTKTGAIVSMIGGEDFVKSPFNRAVQAKRQPGSAFKPFVYAAGIVQGISQHHVLLDAPLSYPMGKNNVWQVNNFSKTYSGEITCRKALALSKNTPVVRLIEQIGVHKVIALAKNAGITSKLSPNLSLALGTSEVSLLELTAAYIPFVNMGVKVAPYSIKKITDADSRLIYQHTIQKQSVFSRQDAAVVTDMLKAVVREGTARKAAHIKKDIAGKTGTTDNYKDALFIGFSPDLALGVWVGNDDATTLGKYETGAKAALPIWIDVMEFHLSQQTAQYFDIPDGLKMVYMDPDTGRLSRIKTSRAVKVLVKEKDVQ